MDRRVVVGDEDPADEPAVELEEYAADRRVFGEHPDDWTVVGIELDRKAYWAESERKRAEKEAQAAGKAE